MKSDQQQTSQVNFWTKLIGAAFRSTWPLLWYVCFMNLGRRSLCLWETVWVSYKMTGIRLSDPGLFICEEIVLKIASDPTHPLSYDFSWWLNRRSIRSAIRSMPPESTSAENSATFIYLTWQIELVSQSCFQATCHECPINSFNNLSFRLFLSFFTIWWA